MCIKMEWSQAAPTPHFFLTHSKRCSAQHLAKYLLAGMFAGVTRCSDAQAQHIWALAQCQDRRLFHFNPNLKKHLPISIRWLLSETECCKRCGCTAPEGLPPRGTPGQRNLQVRCGPVKIHLTVSCCAVGPRCTAITCFNMVRPRVLFRRKGWRGC